MIKVLFVCLGNICRSPMAEGIFKEMIFRENLDNEIHIESRATSTYEIGNRPHPGTRKILDDMFIDHSYMVAGQIRESDFYEYDYIIGMDKSNIDDLNRKAPLDSKASISRLLDYTDLPKKNIDDPWYTNNFIKTKQDIEYGLTAFLEYLKKNKLKEK